MCECNVYSISLFTFKKTKGEVYLFRFPFLPAGKIVSDSSSVSWECLGENKLIEENMLLRRRINSRDSFRMRRFRISPSADLGRNRCPFELSPSALGLSLCFFVLTLDEGVDQPSAFDLHP